MVAIPCLLCLVLTFALITDGKKKKGDFEYLSRQDTNISINTRDLIAPYVKSVAMIVWGDSSTLHLTYKSIIENIYQPLRSANIQFDTYMHTFNTISTIQKCSLIENINPINSSFAYLIYPTRLRVVDRHEVERSLDYSQYYTRGDIMNDKFKSLDDFIRELYSLNEATKMFSESNQSYDRVIFFRTNQMYLEPIDVLWLNYSNPKKVLVSQYFNYPINDRFIISPLETVDLIGRRFESLLEATKTQFFNIDHYLRVHFKIPRIGIVKLPLKCARMLESGVYNPKDAHEFKLTNNHQLELCESYRLKMLDKVKTVALIFWGLCRSTDIILPSLVKNVFEPLTSADISYDVYAHTFYINRSYVNRRSSENGVSINSSLVYLLNPKDVMVENQDEFDMTVNFSAYRTQKDPWKNNYSTLDNLVRGMHSLNEATKLMQISGIKYDRVIFLRPDVYYLDRLNASWLQNLEPKQIILPNFANYPVNDRFAICYPDIAALIGRRFETAISFSQVHPLHSEHFLRYYLKRARVQHVKVNFRFARIRATGTLEPREIRAFNMINRTSGVINPEFIDFIGNYSANLLKDYDGASTSSEDITIESSLMLNQTDRI